VGKTKHIKIDINEVKDTFIANFILIFFNEIKKRNPNSLKIQTICNHYSMFVAKKPQLCISQLRHFSERGLSFLDRITKYVNEQFVLYHYDLQQQKHEQRELQSNFDGEHFIKINDLYSDFHTVVDQLSQNSQEFWKGFTFDEVDVYRQHEFGEKIADLQEKCYKFFKLIEENLIQKDYKIYIWFANIQLMIMNDQEGYQMFMQKMKSIIQMSKIFANITSAKYGDIMSEDAGFVVTDAHASKSGMLLFI